MFEEPDVILIEGTAPLYWGVLHCTWSDDSCCWCGLHHDETLSNKMHSDAAAEALLLYVTQAGKAQGFKSDMLGITPSRLFTTTWQLCGFICAYLLSFQMSMRLPDMLAVERKDDARQAVLSGARQKQAKGVQWAKLLTLTMPQWYQS